MGALSSDWKQAETSVCRVVSYAVLLFHERYVDFRSFSRILPKFEIIQRLVLLVVHCCLLHCLYGSLHYSAHYFVYVIGIVYHISGTVWKQ